MSRLSLAAFAWALFPPVLACGVGSRSGLDDAEGVDGGLAADAVCDERIRIPGGVSAIGEDGPLPDWFVFAPGANICDRDFFDLAARPLHEVWVSGFDIQAYETTAACYSACMRAGACALPSNGTLPEGYLTEARFSRRPMFRLSKREATAYCGFRGGRLPTEAEWERAARGEDGRTYPVGEQLTCALADVARFGSSPECLSPDGEQRIPLEAGETPSDVSFYGVHGMTGGVSEPVSDLFDAQYYQRGGPPWADPTGPTEAPCPNVVHVWRGSNMGSSLEFTHNEAWHRRSLSSDAYLGPHPFDGVRCAWDIR